MKKSKKSRVSWPPDAILCQVKVFQSDDCPAKVSLQPQSLDSRRPSSGKPSSRMRARDLPPGFEGNHYAAKQKLSDIRRIKWKRPPKFVINDSWLVGAGEESTERQTENLRIAKVLEAIYPHRSAIPSRPSVSPDVEAEQYDDRKTPIIRLTPIEDEWEITDESSQTAPQSGVSTNPQGQLESKTPGSTGEPTPAMVSALGADVSVAAYAVLTALMKTKEPGSMIDYDLLVKFLSDPKMVQNLINDHVSKPPELDIPPVVDTKITSGFVSPHVTTSAPSPSLNPTSTSSTTPAAMDRRNSHPPQNVIPLKPKSATSQPVTHPVLESRRVDPPVVKCSAESIEVLSPRFGNVNPHTTPMSGQSGLAHPAQLVSSTLPMNGKPVEVSAPPRPVTFRTFPVVSAGPKPLQRAQPTCSTLPMNMNPVEVHAEPNPVPKPQSTLGTLNMNLVPKPVQKPQPAFDPYALNVNRVELPSRPSPPMPTSVKSLDYFKNLIREHGTVKPETAHELDQYTTQPGIYHGRVENINVMKKVKAKIQKPCMYFTSSRGCKLGDNCMYLHDGPYQWRPDVPVEAPAAKRTKFAAQR